MMRTIGLILMGLGILDMSMEFFMGTDIWYDWAGLLVEETLDPLLAPGLVLFGGAALYLDNMVG